jgi:hypothetical protein
MADIRRNIAKVEAAVKRIDSDVIVQSTFYDDVSNRLFLTLVDGPRKTQLTFTSYDFDDASFERVSRALRASVDKLKVVPIG